MELPSRDGGVSCAAAASRCGDEALARGREVRDEDGRVKAKALLSSAFFSFFFVFVIIVVAVPFSSSNSFVFDRKHPGPERHRNDPIPSLRPSPLRRPALRALRCSEFRSDTSQALRAWVGDEDDVASFASGTSVGRSVGASAVAVLPESGAAGPAVAADGAEADSVYEGEAPLSCRGGVVVGRGGGERGGGEGAGGDEERRTRLRKGKGGSGGLN